MKWLPLASGALFRGLEAADAWMGLPEKLAESLAFRREWRASLRPHRSEGRALWIHGASVGELEDLADFFLSKDRLMQAGFAPDQVVVTGSSVSARSRLREWAETHALRYAGPLPPEKSSEIDAFLEVLDPGFLILSHSDVWPLLLHRARKRLSRALLWLPAKTDAARTLAPRCLAPLLAHIGSRSPGDVEHWATLQQGVGSSFVGNPRIDRILARIEAARLNEGHVLEPQKAAPESDKLSVLLGSAWTEDAEVWAHALALLDDAERARLQLVVLPHHFEDPHQVASIQLQLPKARILPLGGVLLEAYSGFTLSYVGGGFRTGLHNVLEPALWGQPILCGPKTENQPEAEILAQAGQLRICADASALAAQLLEALSPDTLLDWKSRAQASGLRLTEGRGAAQRLALLVSQLIS
jgi:3-deoxy-D-manno-octulosonic-acid transferase